jgi:putative endonuclease
MNKNWQVYIVRCTDNSLYTGITNDIERRLAEHNSQNPKSAKYLRGRTPCTLVYLEPASNKAHASKRELEIKKLSKPAKELLVRTYS